MGHKIKKDPKKITIDKIIAIKNIIANCKNDKDLQFSSSTLTGIRLQRQCSKIIEDFGERQAAVFKKFDVKEIVRGGQKAYDYSGHEDAAKIKAVMKEMAEESFELKGLNEMDEGDFLIFTRGIAQGDVAFLYDYLVNEEPEEVK